MHSPPCARHRDIKLCLVRLAERPNRNAGNHLVDSLRLAGMTGDSYSLVEMQGPSANNLAVFELILPSSMLTTVRSSLLRNFSPAVLDVFRESDPIAD